MILLGNGVTVLGVSPIAPAIDVNANSFVLPPGISGPIGVLGTCPGVLLVLLENNIGGRSQNPVIPAKLG